MMGTGDRNRLGRQWQGPRNWAFLILVFGKECQQYIARDIGSCPAEGSTFLARSTGHIHQNSQSSLCGRKANRYFMGGPPVLITPRCKMPHLVFTISPIKKSQSSSSPVLPKSWTCSLSASQLLDLLLQCSPTPGLAPTYSSLAFHILLSSHVCTHNKLFSKSSSSLWSIKFLLQIHKARRTCSHRFGGSFVTMSFQHLNSWVNTAWGLKAYHIQGPCLLYPPLGSRSRSWEALGCCYARAFYGTDGNTYFIWCALRICEMCCM